MLQDFADSCPNLRKLVFTPEIFALDEDVVALVQNCNQNLVHLDIGRLNKLSRASVDAIAECCGPRLKRLVIGADSWDGETPSIPAEALQNMARCCFNLTHLEMNGFANIDDDFLAALPRMLCTLEIEGPVNQATDTGVRTIVHHLPMLEWVALFWWRPGQISDDTVKLLFYHVEHCEIQDLGTTHDEDVDRVSVLGLSNEDSKLPLSSQAGRLCPWVRVTS